MLLLPLSPLTAVISHFAFLTSQSPLRTLKSCFQMFLSPHWAISEHSVRRFFLYYPCTALNSPEEKNHLAPKTLRNKPWYNFPVIFQCWRNQKPIVWESGLRIWRFSTLELEKNIPSLSLCSIEFDEKIHHLVLHAGEWHSKELLSGSPISVWLSLFSESE